MNWEYKRIVSDANGTVERRDGGVESIEAVLDYYGLQGWELVGFAPLDQRLGTIFTFQYVFKREYKDEGK